MNPYTAGRVGTLFLVYGGGHTQALGFFPDFERTKATCMRFTRPDGVIAWSRNGRLYVSQDWESKLVGSFTNNYRG